MLVYASSRISCAKARGCQHPYETLKEESAFQSRAGSHIDQRQTKHLPNKRAARRRRRDVTMGAGASTDYASVAQALDDGHSQVNIERHLTNACATEIEAINKAFGTDEDRPATAVACGRAAQRALDGLGFEVNNMIFANSTSRDEFTREHHWWAYLEGRATDVVASDKPCPTFDIGGLGGMLAAGKTGLELVASHALEQVGAIFLFFGPHVGCDADGRLGFVQDTPCSSAAAQAVEWAKKNKGATPKDSDDQQMDKVRIVALKCLEAIKEADAPPAAARPPP